MVQNEYILIAVVGKTDPIRSEFDGPILHIARHYRPERIVLILSEEIGKDEQTYHYNENAIHLLDKECQVQTIITKIHNPHSYDDFSVALLNICSEIKLQYPGKKILLDITSGTPQMETAMCMIAMADMEHYIPVQVSTPAKAANKSAFFNPRKDRIEEWFEMDLDNEPGAENRCHVPHLLNYKRPMIQFQIMELIKNYDYAGAWQLYRINKELFSDRVGILLRHAKRRLNLEFAEAEKLAKELEIRNELYPVRKKDILELVEFYNSMHIKQIRGELNDFSLRMEIMTEYLGLYILEKCMNIPKEEITLRRDKTYCLLQNKCEKKIPGISDHLDQRYRPGGFRWGKPLSANNICLIVEYLCERQEFARYRGCIAEMMKWVKFSSKVRNPAAHTIVAITDREIREAYSNEGSSVLCRRIQTILMQVFGKDVSKEAFDIYHTVNDLIRRSLLNENEK